MYDVLRKRRTIRRYSQKKPSINKIKKIIEVARYAPSAHNSQPWRFVIIDDQQKKTELAEAMADEWEKDMQKDGIPYEDRVKVQKESIKNFTNSPLLLLVCLTMEEMNRYPEGKRQSFEYLLAVQSVAASIQNLLIAISIEKLGAGWHCAPLFCQEQVRRVLNLPEHIDPQALITIGYPAENQTARTDSRLTFDEITHYNRWGKRL